MARLPDWFNTPRPASSSSGACRGPSILLLNRAWAFGGAANIRASAPRYALVAVANASATVALMQLFAHFGLALAVAKTITTALLAVANFFLYRHWVFASRRTHVVGGSPSF